MKKCFRLLALVAVLSMPIAASAHGTFTVCDGGEYGFAPIDNPYIDEAGTRTQIIYPAEMLAVMQSEVINSVKFYTDDPITVSGGKIKVLVGETTQPGFTGNDYVEGLTQVATISMTADVNELLITFDTPLLYHGGNLVIETLVEEPTEYCFIPYVGIRPENYSMVSRNEVGKFLPKATFDYGTNADYAAKVIPNDVTFNTVRAERNDVQTVVLKNIGQNDLVPNLSVGAPFAVEQPNAVVLAGEELEIPVTFAPQAKGEYNGVLSIDCGQAGILEVNLHGTAIDAAIDMTVCDSTEYASYVPIYGTDIDIVGTEGQMIYPAEMLSEMAGGKILSLMFHTKDNIQMNGGVIQLSLKVVDETEFAVASLATELTAVATVSPEYGGTDLIFFFDEPYDYRGGNLLVDCNVIEAGVSNYHQTFFYGLPMDYNCSVYRSLWYGSTFDTEFVPFLPKITFSYQKEDSYLRGDVNQDGAVDINDVTDLIDILLTGKEAVKAADCDLDNDTTINDVTTLIDFLLSGNWPN